jgi:hypothetical protein
MDTPKPAAARCFREFVIEFPWFAGAAHLADDARQFRQIPAAVNEFGVTPGLCPWTRHAAGVLRTTGP